METEPHVCIVASGLAANHALNLSPILLKTLVTSKMTF